MPTVKKSNFHESDEGLEAREILVAMVEDNSYNTPTTYCTNEDLYPDHRMSFVDQHMEYLRSHPSVSTKHYLSNLRLRTRIR